MAEPIDIGDDFEAEPVDHNPFGETGSWEGDFPYHPDYLYHGTSDLHSSDIEANGFRAGTYFATTPDIAEVEAQNTTWGSPKTGPGPKAQGVVGGNPVIYAIPKNGLTGDSFTADPEYEGNEYEWGRALISKHPIGGGKMLSGSEVAAHTAALRLPMTAPHLVTLPSSGGLMDEEAHMRRAREQLESGQPGLSKLPD